MVSAETFVAELARAGFGIISGVPCSYLTALINTAIAADDMRYVGAANEGDALAVACGAELGGVHGVTIFQNSGLGNAVNPLTSLTSAFRLPVLIVCSWRGQPGGAPDEPQHDVMGAITPRLFELMGIPWEPFPDSEEELPAVVKRALARMLSDRTPYALIVSKGAIGGGAAAPAVQAVSPRRPPVPPRSGAQPLEPDAALAAIQRGVRDDDVVLATTGFTGRALYALEDRPGQLYMVGSMGCASSMGMGLAIARPERRVVVIDGDGAMLMRMGAVATIAHEAPRNLVHVLLDNAVHDSTGAQATISPFVDLAAVAGVCGYPSVVRATGEAELSRAIAEAGAGPVFIHARTLPRSDHKLPRPTIKPYEVADRLRSWLDESS
jgi:phosphonopyruvate decarboxylase